MIANEPAIVFVMATMIVFAKLPLPPKRLELVPVIADTSVIIVHYLNFD